jgi:nucleolar protein 14
MKGAARELRVDNRYLSSVKEKERIKLEQEKAEESGKNLAFLQEQESAFKSGQLGKGKGRKRRR